jgi:hypothetical protein
MPSDVIDEHTVRRLLENLELKIVLDSPDDDYRFIYFTTSIMDRQKKESRRIRTYQLLDLIRGGVTPEPWDTYDLDKQTTLVTNIIRFSHYRISKVVGGHEITCPKCGHFVRLMIWESIQKKCKRCKFKIDDKDVKEILNKIHQAPELHAR